jgi:hypothetical protein
MLEQIEILSGTCVLVHTILLDLGLSVGSSMASTSYAALFWNIDTEFLYLFKNALVGMVYPSGITVTNFGLAGSFVTL